MHEATRRVYLPVPLNDLWVELYRHPPVRTMAEVGRAVEERAREQTPESADRAIRAMRALIAGSNLPSILSEGTKVALLTVLSAEVARWTDVAYREGGESSDLGAAVWSDGDVSRNLR
jgi:hypothetical protein